MFLHLPHSDNRLLRAYEEFSDKMPSLKRLLDEQGDPELLEMFYKNVRQMTLWTLTLIHLFAVAQRVRHGPQ